MISIPDGIILVTGPTGSGKTTTLYCALNHINSGNNKIITIEDGVTDGGFGTAVLEYANHKNFKNVRIECMGLPDAFIEHGSADELNKKVGLDEKGIEKVIVRFLKDKIS